MCSDEIQHAILEAIRSLDNDKYEYSDPFTIGGATGLYQLVSPYHTECEWAMVSAVGIGTFGFVAPTLAGVPQEAQVPATASALTIFTGSGQLLSAIVTATGAANLTFQDGAGNIIGEVLSTATVGQVIQFGPADFTTSLVANKSASTPVVTVSYAPTVSSAGTLASAATYALGSRNPSQPILVSGQTFSPSGGQDSNPLQSFLGALTNQAPFITYDAQFMPLVAPGSLWLQTSCPSSTAIFVTVQLRRKLEFFIPTIEYRKPHSHTPLSARNARTFFGGFAEGNYRVGTPVNPEPEQDAGRFKRSDQRTYQAVPDPRTLNPMRNLDKQVALHNLRPEHTKVNPNPRERRPRRIG